MNKKAPISSSFIKNLCAETIKLGVDAHLNSYVVVIKVDSSRGSKRYRGRIAADISHGNIKAGLGVWVVCFRSKGSKLQSRIGMQDYEQ